MHIDERALARLPAKLAQTLLGLATEAAKHGVTIDLSVAIAVSRAEAGRLGGQRSASVRRERYGTARPTAPPEANPLLLRSKPEANGEANGAWFKANAKQNPEANTTLLRSKTEANATDPLPLPLGSPSLSLSGSFSDLLQISSLLASSKDLNSEIAHVDEAPKKKRKSPPPRTLKPRWSVVPGDWEPNAQHLAIAAERNVDFKLELAQFRDHEFRSPKSDADACFRTWLRNAQPARRPLGPQVSAGRTNGHATVDDIERLLGNK